METIARPTPFIPGGDWPAPDMTLLQPERPPAPVLSDDDFSEVFGPWADWINTAARAKGAPADYVALALLSVASACIGNSRWPSPWGSWKEPPILWVMLVGKGSFGNKSFSYQCVYNVRNGRTSNVSVRTSGGGNDGGDVVGAIIGTAIAAAIVGAIADDGHANRQSSDDGWWSPEGNVSCNSYQSICQERGRYSAEWTHRIYGR